jgi:hypothetical protein
VAGISDDAKIEKTAKLLAKQPADVDRIIEAVELQAEKLVARHWDDIRFVARALRRLDDHIDEDEMRRLLQDVGKAPAAPPVRSEMRSAPPPPDNMTLDGTPYFRRTDGWLVPSRAA